MGTKFERDSFEHYCLQRHPDKDITYVATVKENDLPIFQQEIHQLIYDRTKAGIIQINLVLEIY